MILVLLLAAYLPPLAWLWFLRTRDRYEPEPKRLVLNLFLLGLGASVPALALGGAIDDALAPIYASGVPAIGFGPTFTIGSILVVALVASIAEVMKYLFASSRIRRDPNFNEPVDGMIYLASVGLGFAAAANAQYVIGMFNASLDLSPSREAAFLAALQMAAIGAVLTTLAHASFSGIAGYYLSRHVLFNKPFSFVIVGLVVATLLHSLYSLALPGAVGVSDRGALSLLPRTAVTAVALAVFVTLFRTSLRESPMRLAALVRASGTTPG